MSDTPLTEPAFRCPGWLAKLPDILIAMTACILLAACLGVGTSLSVIRVLTYPYYLALPASSVVLMGVLLLYRRVFRQRQDVFCLSWLALCAMFIFMIHKPVWHYQYDYPQNISTVEFYAKNHTIPGHDDTAEAHQAPLYYALAAIVYNIARPLVVNGEAACMVVQDINFVFFSLFLLYSILAMLRFIPSYGLSMLGIVALLAWPGNVLHSARISNNILIYLSFVACAYHFLLWQREHSPRQLNKALLWMGLGFASQTTAIVLLASTGTLMLRRWLRGTKPAQWLRLIVANQPDPQQLKQLAGGIAALMGGIAAGYGRNFYNYFSDSRVSVIFGTHTFQSTFIPSELFTLNIIKYIEYPYIVTNLEQGEVNDQFWGYFLRSMSFGQHNWLGEQQAIMMNCLNLLMWVFWAFFMFYHRVILRRATGTAGYYAIYLGYSILAMATVKMLIHEWSPFWADVRYIYAIVPFFLMSYLSLLVLLRPEKHGAFLTGVALLSGYCCFSFIHLYLQLAPMW